MRIGRFIVVTLLAATGISILGHLVSDFDVPDDPRDMVRGIGIWVVALAVAALDARNVRRKSNCPTTPPCEI
jgi:hypothetical protein